MNDPDFALVSRFYNAITVLRCPQCAAATRLGIGRFERPAEYRCAGCGITVRVPGDRCCVYCAYGTVPCAQEQSDARLLRLIGLARRHC